MKVERIFCLYLGWLLACRATPTLQDSTYDEAQRDGVLPIVDVEMVAPKRWQAYRNGLNSLKRELSFVIDRGKLSLSTLLTRHAELERERRRIFQLEDQRSLAAPRASLMQLLPRKTTNDALHCA
ncbi:hypothetical protein BBBOND_0201470 [Babesia bigemina]|uniref:Uncharacterized protein n=1 Tax=Babesia bigemina TaxID=5866 RepID=A0A061DB78_BABBI|nr:hypothetical protein BBBOND_0201470 [Babesia bigemina]CDR94990.1 hypothetical protein BBBOND_0201470 [Babesia bigemina]|eukprot:XP_012767176.1 hypothetical protein BBBOND_0201470 [Babesia bigemina]